MTTAAVACVGVTLCTPVFGQATAPKDASPPDSVAIKAQADKLRSEQFAIGEKLRKEFPEDFEALRIMGFVYSSQGDREKMVECWRKCVELQPNRADVHDQLARYEFQNQSYDTAMEHWQRALAIDPKFPGAHRQIGEALVQSGKADDARTHLQLAAENDPNDSEAQFLLGEVHYQLRELQQAKQYYGRAAELKPTHKQAYYGLIKTCGQLGQRDEVAKYSHKFQQLQSATYAADQEYRKQFDDLQKMREEVAITCIDAGRLYASKNRSAQAEPLWIRACELDEDNPIARNLLGTLYLGQRKAREAVEQFQVLARLEPKDPAHYQQLGFLEARLGNLPAAERYFKQVLVVAPKDAAGYRSLAKFYLNTKREARRAQDLATTAVKLEPIADSYFVLGWAQAVNGHRDDAAAALQKAVEMDPANPTYRQLHEMVRKK
jgi:tetratricopeptide (TPR) repeat protein